MLAYVRVTADDMSYIVYHSAYVGCKNMDAMHNIKLKKKKKRILLPKRQQPHV
jgi:hypothetical protein